MQYLFDNAINSALTVGRFAANFLFRLPQAPDLDFRDDTFDTANETWAETILFVAHITTKLFSRYNEQFILVLPALRRE